MKALLISISIVSLTLFGATPSTTADANTEGEELFKCRIEYSKGTGRFIKVTGKTCDEAIEKLKELLK